MATYLENLTTRRDAIATYLAGLTPGSSEGDLPTSSGDGINPQTMEKIKAYQDELRELHDLIAKAQADEAADAGNVGFVDSYELI